MTDHRHVLLTGGAGYIGSHTVLVFQQAGWRVSIVDSFCNSSTRVIERLEQISGVRPGVFEADVRDTAALARIFSEIHPEAVVHFAGLKAVGESVAQPLRYYENNVQGTLSLLRAMQDAELKRLIFSSSATVYGDPDRVPITEDQPRSATNPYGRSKLMIEDLLIDLCRSDPSWRIGVLRYFNPVGAHASGLIGEDPSGIPNNLMPFVSQVAVGRRERLQIFGDDYDTHDGTGVRDYIHVDDLAAGHVSALEALTESASGEPLIVNLGTGRGYSVLDVVRAFEAASGRSVPFDVVARRPGDIARCYADPGFARSRLDWSAQHGLERMCEDAWRWQSRNPQGFNNS